MTKSEYKKVEVVDTIKCPNGVVIRVRGQHLNVETVARFFLGLPQVNTDKKTA